MKKEIGKRRKEEHKKERRTIAFEQEQKCTHTSPRTEHPVDTMEIFLRSIIV